ncbi:polysaccharide biosynthesis/export family protein [Planctomicrobium sp. SH527]|uniref:polysaccharide biosynthesis/export family protein n=1 Tax=Planctomicrobium sp. SH527 TaxID=3448123 RepID=UPI003F5BA88D
MSHGCSALHPVRGVPAAYLPDQFIGPSRDNKRTIDLSLLVRTPPDQYRVEAGDVISVYVPRVLGVESTDVNSVGISPPINMPSSIEDPPTVGYPIQVRDDHTISLPQIPPLQVRGMTLHEVEQAILKAYTVDHHILNPSEALVMVSLQRPRITRVLVVRQEATTSLSAPSGAGSVNIGTTGKGTARTVTLKAYENDVLHALARAEGVDGLPGLNAENVIYVIRRRARTAMHHPTLPPVHGPIIQQSAVQDPNEKNGVIWASGDQLYDRRVQTVAYEQPSQQPAQQPIQQTAQAGYRSSNGHSFAPQYSQPVAAVSASTGHSMSPQVSYRSRGGAAQSQMDYLNAVSNAQRQVQVTSVQTMPAQTVQQPPVEQVRYQHGIMGGQSVHGASHAMTMPAEIQPMAPGITPGMAPIADPAYQYPQMPAPYQSGVPQPGPPQPGLPQPGLPQLGPPMNEHVGPASVEQNWTSMLSGFDPTIDNPNVIRIPIRLGPGEVPQITEESITLYDGDIIFIESRETEVFYTAGLLGGGQYTLPRDYDLCVLEAVSIAESRQMGGGQVIKSMGGVSALNQDISASASRLAIIRTLPNGKRVTIEVDLKKAMRYQEENIRIQPADVLVLQYTFPEAVGAFTQRYILEGAVFGVAAGLVTGN